MNVSTGYVPPSGALSHCQLFDSLAGSTWDWLGLARDVQLAISEDSITDITALEIARSRLNGVTVTRVTKRMEGSTGFDWMWFIAQRGRGYVPYAVQAKKMKIEKLGNYSYPIRYRSGSDYQLCILKRFAQRVGAIPLYCFYNNVDSSTAREHWNCRQQPCRFDVRHMGCTLAALHAVEAVHAPRETKNFGAIHQDPSAVPWRCIFHPSCVGRLASAAAVGSRSDATGDPPDGPVTARVVERLPDFLLEQRPTVEFDEVIRQLSLETQLRDGGHDDMPDRNIAVPEWFMVIETDSG